MPYKLFLYGKKAVKIIARFDHSILIEYVVGGRQASVNPKHVKCRIIKYTKKTPIVKQLKLKL
jgi:hypothetical protein